jgi:hypothetical protein
MSAANIDFVATFGKTRKQLFQEYSEAVDSTTEEIVTATELLEGFISPGDTAFSGAELQGALIDLAGKNMNDWWEARTILANLQEAKLIEFFDSEGNLLEDFDAWDFYGQASIRATDGAELNQNYIDSVITLLELFGADATKVREIRNEMMDNVISE